MTKTKKIHSVLFTCAAAMVMVVLSGCRTSIRFSAELPGEYNLSGVSKIAMLDFNSIPDDPVVGAYQVDEETKKIVEDMVSTVIFKGQTYKITDLDVEKLIADAESGSFIRLGKRFDAIMYGRVWWQRSYEFKNVYPQKYTLSQWHREAYQAISSSGRYYTAYTTLTDRTTEVKADHRYRTSAATLMLSLTIYRLGSDGKIEKIVEDFAVADQKYLLDNGQFSTEFVPHYSRQKSHFERISSQSEDKDAKAAREARERSGNLNADRNAQTIPSDLQTKIMLGLKLAETLGNKMTPHHISVEVKEDYISAWYAWDWFDCIGIKEDIYMAMRRGDFDYARKKLISTIRNSRGYAIADRIGSLSAYERMENSAEVAADPAEITPEDVDDVIDDFEDELYAIAICEEAAHQYDFALENYRALMRVTPEKKYALGVSRCLAALNITDKLHITRKEVKKASEKADLR